MAATNELESPAGSSRRRRAASGGGPQGSAKRRRRRQGGPSSPASGGSASAVAGSSSEQGTKVNDELPMGRGCAKKLRSSSNNSSSSAASFEVQQEVPMDPSAQALVALEARKVAVMERKVQIQEKMCQLREEEEEIDKVKLLAAAGSSSEQDVNVNDELLPPKILRPLGIDGLLSNSSSSSTAFLEVLQKMSMGCSVHELLQEEASEKEREALVALEARKVTVMERKVQIQEKLLQLREEEGINKVMLLDIEKLPPSVRDHYVDKQKKIAAKAKKQ